MPRTNGVYDCVCVHITGKLVVDPVKLQPICRLGGTMYGRVTELFDIGRPVSAQSHLGPAEYTASYKNKPLVKPNTKEPPEAKKGTV